MTAMLELPDMWVAAMTDAVLLRMETEERWVTTEGLADWLGCNAEQVYDLRQRGLPARRIPDQNGRPSKKLFFSLREVSGWFDVTGVAV